MGVLAPLFLAGLTALSLPLILHLVRRTPRGRQEFSSLMFLSPSPPRLTRRSRLDQILLLLLRLAALALIAVAFARPFLRESASLTFANLSARRVALLMDVSASMRRGDLWEQAVKFAEQELEELNPQDDVALFSFSERVRTLIGFQQEHDAPIPDKTQVVRNYLRELQPEWGATDLGTALATVAADLDAATDVQQSAREPVIVVISDFQSGSRIEALQSIEWPERVSVVTRMVAARSPTNAHVQLLPSEEEDSTAEPRVRVENAADSRGDQFFVSWASDSPSAATAPKSEPLAVYVPPGQSRVIRLPRGADSLQADRVVLRGDEQDFDNSYFVVPPRVLTVRVRYAGDDAADDPNGTQFYLRLATANDPLRQVEVLSLDQGAALSAPRDLAPSLVVATQAVSNELQDKLKSYVERGGTLLLVPRDDEAAGSLFALIEDVELATRRTSGSVEPPGTAEQELPRNNYQLLGEIDFQHPLFAPFASPRYSDFTRIHFWKHRPVKLTGTATTRVIARFDNGDPALLERTIGQGRVLALTSSWHPEESQFALSSKFVPWAAALLDLACGGTELAENRHVHQPVTLTNTATVESVIVTTPTGQTKTLPPGVTTFTETDQPGLYSAKLGSTEIRFAVNLAASESQTAPLDLEQLQQRGVRFGADQTRSLRLQQVRQQRDSELENRQKIWRWLIVLALGILMLETWWAGRADRQIRVPQA